MKSLKHMLLKLKVCFLNFLRDVASKVAVKISTELLYKFSMQMIKLALHVGTNALLKAI
jgi:hypothetical protein